MAMDIHLTQACREREREMPILIRESKSGTLYWDTRALSYNFQTKAGLPLYLQVVHIASGSLPLAVTLSLTARGWKVQ
jgi:hypothetical protein